MFGKPGQIQKWLKNGGVQRILLADSFADKKGNIVPATYYGMNPKMPLEMQIIITFEDTADGKTKMTLIHEGIPAGEDSEGAKVGWNTSFDKFEEMLKK